MALPDDGFQRVGELKTKTTGLAGTHSNMAMLVTEDVTGISDLLDTTGWQNGGGDIRASSDEAGANLLNIDVVSCVTAVSAGSRQLQLFILFPNVRSSQVDSVHLWKSAGATMSQPAASAAGGKYGTWADYAAVYHGADLTNAAGTAGTLSAVGNAAVDAAGLNGRALSFDGSGDYFDTTLVPASGGAARAITMLVNRDVTSDVTFLSWGRTLAGQRWTFHLDLDRLRTSVQSGYSRATTGIATGAWTHVGQVLTGTTASDIEYFLNGSADAFDNGTTRTINTATDNALRVGGDHFGEEIYSGLMQEIRIRDSNVASVTADWIATEEENLRNPQNTVEFEAAAASVAVSVAATGPSPGAAASGQQRQAGSVGAAGPAPGAAVSGRQRQQGSASVSTQAPTAGAAGQQRQLGSAAVLAGQPVANLAAEQRQAGSVGSDSPAPEAALAGHTMAGASVAADNPTAQADGVGLQRQDGTVTAEAQAPEADVSGEQSQSGSIDGAGSPPEATISTQSGVNGTVAAEGTEQDAALSGSQPVRAHMARAKLLEGPMESGNLPAIAILSQRRVARILRQAAWRPVDVFLIGDSNARPDVNYGFTHGLSHSWAAQYGLYASAVTPFGDASDTGGFDTVYDSQDHATTLYHASGLLDPTGLPAGYDPYTLPGKTPAVYANGFDTAAVEEGLVVYNLSDGLGYRDQLRYVASIGTFVSGGQALQFRGKHHENNPVDFAAISPVYDPNTGSVGEMKAVYDMPANAGRSNHMIVDLHGDTGTAYTGEFVGFWHRVENVSRDAGVAVSCLYGVGGDSTTDVVTWLATVTDAQIENYFEALTYFQRQRGHDPALFGVLNMGFNDRNEADDSAATYKANVKAINDRLEARWLALGYPAENYGLLAIASHPRRTADAELEAYRQALVELDAEEASIQHYDFTRSISPADIDANGWYEGPGATQDIHLLPQVGYEGMADILTADIHAVEEATVIVKGHFTSGFSVSSAFLDFRKSSDASKIALRLQTSSSNGFIFGIHFDATMKNAGGGGIETAVKQNIDDNPFVIALAIGRNNMRWSFDGDPVVVDTIGVPMSFDEVKPGTPAGPLTLSAVEVYQELLSDDELMHGGPLLRGIAQDAEAQGNQPYVGSISGTSVSPLASLAGLQRLSASLDAQAISSVAALTGIETAVATVSADVPAQVARILTQATVTGSVSGAGQGPQASLDGQQSQAAQLAISGESQGAGLTGRQRHIGSVAAELTVSLAALSGSAVHRGTLEAVSPAATAQASEFSDLSGFVDAARTVILVDQGRDVLLIDRPRDVIFTGR